jgi:hypothetical protein
MYSALLSGQGNMFVSLSLAVGIIGFSNTFNDPIVQFVIKILGSCMFIVAVWIGIKVSADFKHYIGYFDGKLPESYPVKSWKSWPFVSYVYVTIVSCLAILYLVRKARFPI